MRRRRSLFLLVCIISISGFTKIMLFFWGQAIEPDKIFLPDSSSYINTARAFLETGRFAISPKLPDVPQVIRTPGYPFFIASSFFLFDEEYAPLIVIQIFLNLGTLIIVYHLANMLWGPASAVLSVLLLSLDIPFFMSSQYVLTEALFTFLLCIAVMSMTYSVRKPQYVLFLAFSQGIFLAFVTLIRPIAYYLIIPVLVTFIIFLRVYIDISWKKIAIGVILLITPYIIFVGGWQVRNYLMTGRTEFSYIQGFNLLFYRGAGIIVQRDGKTLREAQQYLGYDDFVQLPPEKFSESIAELSQYWKHKSFRLFLQHPVLLLKDQTRGVLKMMFMPGEDSLLTYIGEDQAETGPIGDLFTLSVWGYMRKWILGKPKRFLLFLIAQSVLILLYTSIGISIRQLITLRKSEWSIHLYIWGIILYFVVISAGPEAYARFRIPIIPFLAVYGGHGIIRMLRMVNQRKHDNE